MSRLIAHPVPPQPHPYFRRPAVEVLESRIAPATVAPGTFTYTDADGDAIKIDLLGKGSVDFLDASGADVSVSHLSIAKIVVTAPNSAFALLVSDTNVTGD